MPPPKTYEIQSGYALGLVSMKEIIGWAVGALEAGFDSKSLRILAGLDGDIDQQEVARLHSACFKELDISPLPEQSHLRFYASLVLREMLADRLPRREAFKRLSELCISLSYPKELMDFYLLYHAKWDLESAEVQWYWKGADRSNIDAIIDEHATSWLQENVSPEA